MTIPHAQQQPSLPPTSSSHHHPPTPPAINLHPTESLPPPLRTIRRSVELLSVSYFLNIFGSILAIQNFSISKLEADLDGTQPDSYIPILIPKLLVALTGDRSINAENWQSRLRREFLRRQPSANPLGEQPLQPKPKIPKRLVGYVYIPEPVPPSTVPQIEGSDLKPAQLSPSQDHPDHQTHNHPPHSIDASDHPDGPLPHQVGHSESRSKESSDPSCQQDLSLAVPSDHQIDPTQSSLSSSELVSSSRSIPPQLSEPVDQRSSTIPSSDCSSPTPNRATSQTIIWSSLPPKKKLETLQKLCEWHFTTSHDLERFRRLVDAKAYSVSSNSLDERIDWRQERCGIDGMGNQYWLCGRGIESRLWIQRPEPEPPRKAITLRIPARDKRRAKNLTRRASKRQGPEEPSPTTPLTSNSRRGRRASNAALPVSKRPRLSGTRSSTRLRASQVDSTNPPTPSRPPTMIVIKKASMAATAPVTPVVITRFPNSSKRPSPRQRGTREVWQDVPPGWLEEVVQPTPQPISQVFSSDLSDMSDEEEVLAQVPLRSYSKPVSKPPLKVKKPITEPPEPGALSDGSLSDLTESREASSVVTSESVSNDLDIPIEESKVQVNGDRSICQKTRRHPKSTDGVEPTTENLNQDGDNVKPLDDTLMDSVATDQAPTPITDPPDPPGGHLQSTSSSDSAKTDTTPAALYSSDPVRSKDAPISEACGEEKFADCHQSVPKAEPDSLPPVQDEQASSRLDDSECHFPELKGHPLDPDWIEWEVLCSSLDEWKDFGLRFQNTENPSEKQLVDFINQEVLPDLLAAFHAEEARRQKEEAMAQRKRSSRIATRTVMQTTAMEADIFTRETRMHSDRLEAKRLKEIEMEEARKQAEEEQRLLRLKEREERVAQREALVALEKEAEFKRAERARLRAESKLLGKAVKVARPGAENSVPSIDSAQQWELDCEICGLVGVNMDDGSEVICCEKCEKWQHLVCHDRADEIVKRPKRDWATEDFMCSNCSGIPIPRVVKRLRTHADGKPKPKPRPRVSKSSQDPTLSNSNPSPSEASTLTKPKLTLLMSNPNSLGGDSLSEVSSNPVPPYHVQQQQGKPRSEHLDPSFCENPTPNGSSSLKTHPSLVSIPATTPAQPSATITNSRPSSASNLKIHTMATSVPDLTMYYNDLEKLCSILRSNANLHRSLPIEVMHRLRRYLLDQQQQLRGQAQQQSININHTSSSSCNRTIALTQPHHVEKSSISDTLPSSHDQQSSPGKDGHSVAN